MERPRCPQQLWEALALVGGTTLLHCDRRNESVGENQRGLRIYGRKEDFLVDGSSFHFSVKCKVFAEKQEGDARVGRERLGNVWS